MIGDKCCLDTELVGDAAEVGGGIGDGDARLALVSFGSSARMTGDIRARSSVGCLSEVDILSKLSL